MCVCVCVCKYFNFFSSSSVKCPCSDPKCTGVLINPREQRNLFAVGNLIDEKLH